MQSGGTGKGGHKKSPASPSGDGDGRAGFYLKKHNFRGVGLSGFFLVLGFAVVLDSEVCIAYDGYD